MAGDWIPWSCGLETKPELIEMSHLLNLPAPHVAGLLCMVWSWAGYQTTTGKITPGRAEWIDRITGVAGFADSMQKVGWLRADKRSKSGSLAFPNWQDWNSNSAKQRLSETKRKRRSRAHSVPAVSHPERDNGHGQPGTTAPDRTGEDSTDNTRTGADAREAQVSGPARNGPDPAALAESQRSYTAEVKALATELLPVLYRGKPLHEFSAKDRDTLMRQCGKCVGADIATEARLLASEKAADLSLRKPISAWWAELTKRYPSFARRT